MNIIKGPWSKRPGPDVLPAGREELEKKRLTLGGLLKNEKFYTVLISGAVAVLCVFVAVKTNMITAPDSSIKTGELDLSGTWKIWYDDSPAYAEASLDDSAWCLITVPDSGLKPVPLAGAADGAGLQRPSPLCPRDHYPVDKMMSSTYWYRKQIVIHEGTTWKDPSLFLGNIKHEGWVYWDGRFVARVRTESTPIFLAFEKNMVRAGVHQLSVRVRTDKTLFPGIFHAYPRKVALGEYKEAVKSIKYREKTAIIEPFSAFVVQVLALFLMLFFMVRSQKVHDQFLWLSIYFGASAVCACVVGGNPRMMKWLIDHLSFIGMSAGIFGYGLCLFSKKKSELVSNKIIILAVLFLFIAVDLIAYFINNPSWPPAKHLDVIAIVSSLLFMVGSLIYYFIGRQFRKTVSIAPREWLVVAALFSLHALHAYERFLLIDRASFIHMPLVTTVLTLLVMAFAIEDHVYQEKELAFFGRFLRSGLKDLLIKHKSDALRGTKIVQGRRVYLLKIDIIGHTDTTFGMPYGLKRMFQDYWFSTIDRVVAQKTFMDRPEGDGSVYYFADTGNEDSLKIVVDAITAIRDEAVARFDALFMADAKKFVASEQNLAEPARIFLEKYQAKTGQSFWDKKTRVRFVLLGGYVDEGFWGMLEKGHYDVQGDLNTLAARLEKEALASEIVINLDVAQKLKAGNVSGLSDYEFCFIEKSLKGIGPYRFAVLKSKSELATAA